MTLCWLISGPKWCFEKQEEQIKDYDRILLKEEAEARRIAYEFPCRMITLNIHSSLDAVGFLARMTAVLADQKMGVNPVSGFYHDHLFVPDGKEQVALSALHKLAKQS